MRRSAWGGAGKPRTDEEARQRLLEATGRCIERHGAVRTTLADVAAEAGVTRQTVYRYFEDGRELIRTAMFVGQDGLVGRLLACAQDVDDPLERIVEILVFLTREIPLDPYLRTVFVSGTPPGSEDDLLGSDVAIEAGVRALRTITGDGLGLDDAEFKEFVEFLFRMLKSLLGHPGPRVRSEDELREFLRRWILPGLNRPRRRARSDRQ